MIDTDGTTFTDATLRVLRNMTERVQLIARDHDAQAHRTAAASFAQAMAHVATPGIRLWPDNGRDDCLSLSGSLHGLSFGLIWHESKRRCLTCDAMLYETADGAELRAYRYSSREQDYCADGQHTPDIPADAVTAGMWSFHS